MWVSETDFSTMAKSVQGELLKFPLHDWDPRWFDVRTRRDLGNRMPLYVEGGSARFSQLRIWRGAPRVMILVSPDTGTPIPSGGRECSHASDAAGNRQYQIFDREATYVSAKPRQERPRSSSPWRLTWPGRGGGLCLWPRDVDY